MNLKLIRQVSAVAVFWLIAAVLTTAAATASPRTPDSGTMTSIQTTTPIKHVVVIIGENHSFDNVFATYQPPGHQHIRNLLSEGIVSRSGEPGSNFAKASQETASNTSTYTLTPKVTGTYQTLPQPDTTYVSSACDGLPGNSPDTRFPANLANGPFQITRYVPYFDSHLEYSQFGQCELFGAYVGDPLHRFYQMWQQTTASQSRLSTWVANTAGDDNGAIPPPTTPQDPVHTGLHNIPPPAAPTLPAL